VVADRSGEITTEDGSLDKIIFEGSPGIFLSFASLVFPALSFVTAVSQGSVGGGVVTAIARALGERPASLICPRVLMAVEDAVTVEPVGEFAQRETLVCEGR
jgi:hypothetical protein